MTITERLQRAITEQQREVDRLNQAVKSDLADAQAKLDTLKMIAARVTPSLEESFAIMRKFGIRFDE